MVMECHACMHLSLLFVCVLGLRPVLLLAFLSSSSLATFLFTSFLRETLGAKMTTLTNIVSFPVHACNTHLSPVRRAPNPSASAGTTTTTNTHNSGNTNNTPSSALPTSAIYTPNTSSYANAYPTNYGSQTHTPIPAQMCQRPMQMQTQTIDVTPGAHASSRPVVIQLAPPPPPRTRRRRADAIPFGMGGGVSGHENPQSNTYSHAHAHSNSGSSGSHEHDALEPGRASAEVDYYYDYSRQASSYMEGQGLYARQREPIVLTYEPPKPADRSLFETTDTEREMEMEMSAEMSAEAEGEVVDAEEEAEMERDKEKGAARALLSRSGSLSIPVGGGARGPRTRNGSVRRTSVKRRTSGGKAYAATKSHPPSSSSHSYWRTKSKPVDDPNTYIRKRGLVPPAAQPKRFFGWEFGWDAAPVDGQSRSRSRGGSKANLKTSKGGVVSMREVKEREESSFIDLRGDHGFGRGLGLGLGLGSGSGNGNGNGKEKSKLMRHSMLSSVSTVRSPLGGIVNYGDAEKEEGLKDQVALGGETGRKLKKRSKSNSRPGTADSAVPLPVLPYSHRLSTATVTTGSPVSASAPPPPPPSSPSGIAFCLGRGFGLGHRKVKSGSSGSGSRPGTADSYASYASANSAYGKAEASKRGLQLKKSFKLGVGRTLGPGLTLAVASGHGGDSVGGIRERGYGEEREKRGAVASMADVDEDGDIRSIATARLVSASIARATPAATIMAAPGTPSPHRTSYSPTPSQESTPNANGRPVRPTIVTVGPASSLITLQNPLSPIGRTPSSSITPKTSKSTWKPHPFADPAEGPMLIPSPAKAEVDDDVVQLEREMEEIRGMKDDCRDSDNEKALLDFNATLSPDVPPLADKAKLNDVPANDEKAFGCHAQKRNALSSPPVQKSDWAPQPTSATTGGFPYRFPMIFPSSLTSSSASGSPPRTSVFSLSSQQNQPNSAPSTPRGGQSTLRMSTKTMDTVRSAFAGVGARMSSATARMSVNGGAGGSTRGGLGSRFGETVMEDSDGDFMDLRDPFASPPPATSKLLGGMMKNRKSGTGAAKEGDNFLVIDSYEPEDVDGRGRRMMMSAWGKFPMPVRSLSPIPSSGAPSTASVKRNSKGTTRTEGKPATGHRKHKKEKRTKKSTLPSMANALSSAKAGTLRAGDEDADFGLEEALLSQRLLRSLDSDHWEGRA
ncbi:hypothetical protein BDZ97DRAFT_1346228 [Flammula alnicola]|nr:hypothetical protein BDZ97DRAFT_1346228 [Flammula alnicola]